LIVFGRNPVREALRGRRTVRRVVALEATAGEPWLKDHDVGAGVPLDIASAASHLDRLCGSPDHQGLCADVDDYPYARPDSLLEPVDALAVCLDQVQDPQNLGAVCRVAECAGATGVAVSERRSAGVTPAVCRASAGAVEHLAVARVANLADFLVAAKRSGAWVYGAAQDGTVHYDAIDYGGRVVLVLGSEGRGLRPRVAAACDELVALPVRGHIESLNVSSAAAALLYGILHLREAG
jgi:23S rRNA (guanosine2251-2'-O)-methyltransferase